MAATGDAEADAKQRILALMNELSDPSFASGRRAYPRTLDPDDAMFIAGKLQEAVDEGTEVRARKAAAEGMTIACGEGCTYCCEQPILVWLAEALRVADWLRRPENAASQRAFLAAYPLWREQIGADTEAVGDAGATGDRLLHLRAFIAAFQKRVLCAFNHGGRCSIYPVRPIICRHHHALETNARCNADDESHERRQYLHFKPLDDFVERAHRVSASMHHALGGQRGRTVALCQAVYDLLMEPDRR